MPKIKIPIDLRAVTSATCLLDASSRRFAKPGSKSSIDVWQVGNPSSLTWAMAASGFLAMSTNTPSRMPFSCAEAGERGRKAWAMAVAERKRKSRRFGFIMSVHSRSQDENCDISGHLENSGFFGGLHLFQCFGARSRS
jgi:hypothetical protein